MERAIIHLNIADFAVAVETSLQPTLAGYPLVIAPLGAPRAVVYDMSEEAFQQGIRKGMPLARAKRLNKKIKILPPSFHRYEKVMKRLFREGCAFTPMIESGSRDGHLYLDVTGSSRLFGPSVDVAFRLKKTFKKQFSLDPVWSVAPNKLVAKVATRVVKPLGEYIVGPGEESAFLAPLPVHLLPGLEKNDLKKLHEFNLARIAQARSLTLEQLKIPFDHKAPRIHAWLRGIDMEPVGCPAGRIQASPPIQADHEFKNDTNCADQLKKGLCLACEALCRTLRDRKLACARAKLTLSYSDGRQSRAQHPLTPPTANEFALLRQVMALLERAWTRRVRIRHLRLNVLRTGPASTQAELFPADPKETRQAELVRVMERIRKKFGREAIHAGPAFGLESGQP